MSSLRSNPSITGALSLALLSTALLPGTARAQDRITAYKGARILPVAGQPIDDGVLIVAGGKVQLVGDASTTIPEGASIVDVSGRTITPGLIDAGTTIGVSGIQVNEQGDEITPQIKVVDAIDPADRRFDRVLRGGVTTVQVNPGNLNVIGGLGAIVKTHGDTLRDMLVADASGMRLAMGGAPSSGNRAIRGGVPIGIHYRRPTTRMGVVWEARKAFYDAMAYRQRKTIDDGQGPEIDPGLEVLVAVLDKKVRVHTSAAAEQDIRTAIRLAQEFGYDTLIEEATEAWRLVGELKESGMTVLISAPSATASAPDRAEARYHTLNLLAEAEVPFAIHTGSQLGTLELVQEAMFAVRHGLSPEAALAAITIRPARILGIDATVGSLAPGKDADFVIWTGDPFAPTTRAERVLIAGREVQP